MCETPAPARRRPGAPGSVTNLPPFVTDVRWVRVFTRSSRCSTTARKAVVAASISAVPSACDVSAAIPTDSASASSFLRPCPLDSTRTRAARFAGTSITSMPSVRSSVVSGAPDQRLLRLPSGRSASGARTGAAPDSRRGRPARARWPMAAVNHPPRPRSTTPCADQPQPRPDHRISSSPQPAPTSLCLDSIQKRGGHTNFRQRRPLFSHSPQGRR
ncbi:MAG: hypothetical protein QOC62_3782 [Mycobacterium sp.]|jgi:hypothetical protein|nr:hypothetical protein [Mycobacterium sp.]